MLCFSRGVWKCLWLLAQTSPTEEEEKQSYETGWSPRCCNQTIRRGMLIMHWMHWKGTSRGCTRKRKERQGVGCITAYPAPGSSRWKEGAMGCQASNWFCKGILADEDPSRLLLSLFSHEHFFAVFPDMKEKNKKAILRIPGQTQQWTASCRLCFCTSTENAPCTDWEVGRESTVGWSKISTWHHVFCFAIPESSLSGKKGKVDTMPLFWGLLLFTS